MTFGNPDAFYWAAAAFLLAAALAVFGLRKRDALLARFAAPRLLEGLTRRAGPARSAVKAGCVLLGILAAGLALTRPQYGVELIERRARGLDIVFALDVSRSMLADDLRPDRLQRAKFAVLDLLQRLEGDRAGLVAFAGQAFLQCPPTLDTDAFRESLQAAGPGALTRGGSDLGAALREAAEAFPAENNVKVAILLTDGEDLAGGALEAAREAAEAGITVHTIGVGTPAGTYLRVSGAGGRGDYIRDADGQPVLSRLEEESLRRVAALTGGRYSRLGDGSLEALYNSVLASLPRSERGAEIREVPVERFQWLIGAALVFLVLEMLIQRRSAAVRAALAVAIACLLLPPAPLNGQAPMEPPPETPLTARVEDGGGETEERDPRRIYNHGVEQLQAGEFEAARDTLARAVRASDDLDLQRDALYNLGLTEDRLAEAALATDPVAALEHLQMSEKNFAAAAEIDPADKAAAAATAQIARRRETVEQWLEQQEQEQSGDRQDPSQEGEDREDEGDGQDGDPSQQNDAGERQDPGGQDKSEEPGDSGENESEGKDGDSGTREDAENDSGPDPSAAGEEEEGGSEAGAEEPGGEEQGTAAPAGVDRMSEEEARAVLEAIRGSERLLPFGEPGEPGNEKGGQRDW